MKLKKIIAGLLIAGTAASALAQSDGVTGNSMIGKVDTAPEVVMPPLRIGGLRPGQVMLITDSRLDVMSEKRLAQDPSFALKLAKVDFCIIR